MSRPGTYMVYNNHHHPRRLGYGGGPNEFADKSHVTLMRQSDRGGSNRSTSIYPPPRCCGSEYYYLLPNDVVYVPPCVREAAASTLGVAIIPQYVEHCGSGLTAIQNNTRLSMPTNPANDIIDLRVIIRNRFSKWWWFSSLAPLWCSGRGPPEA
ncbi:MAG: hypothetical protein IPP83_16185 [Flavobacteriales bacterium]|nr:hypothetical protein [Flavobacteriales bacterium]